MEYLDLKAVEKLFADLSVRLGKMYDNTDPKFVLPHIQSFVRTYNIAIEQLLGPYFKVQAIHPTNHRSRRP
ncbi:hypothetical protein FRB94_014263 [Tulasnella sp. JGI-2019a]|nr:hypothetical protein FRB93_005385 [Tulasnella sp. JGI-2019a]KAG9014170.1 hypothetical protein FRB94_014263 [Tulasnella sp. JGI-2019a]KAG9029678.1 hypothetical protein FRB95_005019 [Tulasnella sp. JGI-2019a]